MHESRLKSEPPSQQSIQLTVCKQLAQKATTVQPIRALCVGNERQTLDGLTTGEYSTHYGEAIIVIIIITIPANGYRNDCGFCTPRQVGDVFTHLAQPGRFVGKQTELFVGASFEDQPEKKN